MRVLLITNFQEFVLILPSRKMVIRILMKCLVRRSKWLLPILLWSVLMLITYMSLGELNRALLPHSPDQDLTHFRRTTDLDHYLRNIKLLIEPSTVPCNNNTSLVVLVSSAPSHYKERQNIRNTWGKHLPTLFFLGIQEYRVDSTMTDNYVEADETGDMIVHDFRDHYQNLTLKSVLMLQWSAARCPGVQYMFKTDDDVLVNPWALEKVLRSRPDAELLGYIKRNSYLHRDPYNKWYVPRWLHTVDFVPRYLSGTGYLIKGKHAKPIVMMAKRVPLINLEDVYLTYLVADVKLGYKLDHSYKLSPYKPWISLDCAYWTLASMHSFTRIQMQEGWERILKIYELYKKDPEVCSFYKDHIESELLFY